MTMTTGKKRRKVMQQATINVPDNYPQDRLRRKITEIETILKKEAEAFRNRKSKTNDSYADPWDALDIEAVAVDTGRTDGSVNHDHYIYGIPKDETCVC